MIHIMALDSQRKWRQLARSVLFFVLNTNGTALPPLSNLQYLAAFSDTLNA